MEKSSGERVLQSILLSVREKKGVPDEEIRDFVRKLGELLENSKCSALPEAYHALNEEVELYEEFDLPAMSELYHVFSMGQLRGVTRLADEIRRCGRLSEIVEEDLQGYLSKYHVFKLTEQQPGITHKELARKSDMKVSNLTHFMEKAESAGYFYSWRNGRNKYYHLGKKGKILLEKMEELKAAEQDIAIREQSLTEVSCEHLDNNVASDKWRQQLMSAFRNKGNRNYHSFTMISNDEGKKVMDEFQTIDGGGFYKTAHLELFDNSMENKNEVVEYV